MPNKQVEFHATKQLLIDTVRALLQNQHPGSITSDQVLAMARVSSGSLYHHFEDFKDLMEQVLCAEYLNFTSRTIELLEMASEQSETFTEWAAGIETARRMTHGPAYENIRALRVWTVAQSAISPRSQQALSAGQDRVNEKFIRFIDEGKGRGWIYENIDSRAIASFIQAYTFGSILNDVAETELDWEVWMNLLDLVIGRSFLIVPKKTDNQILYSDVVTR